MCDIVQFLRLELAAFIGGLLGYCSMRYQAADTITTKLRAAAKSVAMGMFAAWLVFIFAIHAFNCHVNVAIALGGLASFGGGEAILLALYQRGKKQIENGTEGKK